MPTYGKAETAIEHPKPESVAQIDCQLAFLQAERAIIVAKCNHHFVPEVDVSMFHQTQVAGVYDAGTIAELDGGSSSCRFILRCTKCDHEEEVPVAARCPICAGEIKGFWGNGGEIPKYFGHHISDYNGLWLINCTCGFKAAGVRYDR